MLKKLLNSLTIIPLLFSSQLTLARDLKPKKVPKISSGEITHCLEFKNPSWKVNYNSKCIQYTIEDYKRLLAVLEEAKANKEKIPLLEEKISALEKKIERYKLIAKNGDGAIDLLQRSIRKQEERNEILKSIIKKKDTSIANLKIRPWYDSPAFYITVGIVLGTGITVSAILIVNNVNSSNSPSPSS